MGTRTADEARATTGTEATHETEAKGAPQETNQAEATNRTEAQGASTAPQAEATSTAEAAGEAGAQPETREAGEAGQAGETAVTSEAAESGESGETAETDEAGTESAGSAKAAPAGIGQGAGAVVSAALGLVSLTGSWLGTVAGAREQLVGQLRTSTSASVATQIKEVYGDAWHTTALWGGLFALLALIVGVVVLARPAFGAPGRPQAPWTKSVAWAGVALGAVGLLLAVLKYTDVLLALPSA
ncbi:hypothetical protein [Streptomyces sp. NPDC056160]|uniref:hypothetical protein n=1 Tax=Streptomyces sp. NPDC056160 TaxID=3345731 RepID=UPI0035E35A69